MAVETSNRNLSFESESTYGTDIIAGSPDVFFSSLGDGPRIAPRRTLVEDESIKGIHSGNPHKTFASHCDVNIEALLRGKGGAAGTAAVHAALLKAAGFEETLNATTSAVYKPITYHTDAKAPAVTVYEDMFQSDGQRRRNIATGARGNLTFNLEADQYARVTFAGIGLFTETSAIAAGTPNLTGYDGSRAPMLVRAMTLSLGADTHCPMAVEIGTNWSVEEDRGACGTNSLRGVYLRRPGGSRMGGRLTFRDPSILTKLLGGYGTDAIYDLAIALSNGTDTLTITSKVQFGHYERAGGSLIEYGADFFCLPTSGEDDLILTFT